MSAQIPESLRAGLRQQWGYPVSKEIPPAGWGFNGASQQLDTYDKYTAPADASEVVHMLDQQRCVVVPDGAIVPAGVAFELARIEHIPDTAVGVIERIPTVWPSAVALDAGGLPLFTYAALNGENPCRDELIHPTAGVGPLRWTFRVTLSHVPTFDAPMQPLQGPIPGRSVPGDDLLPPWQDLRYGTATPWGERQQLIVRTACAVRYWVVLSGPQNRYAVTIGARLGGYWQLTGRRSAALKAATTRTV